MKSASARRYWWIIVSAILSCLVYWLADALLYVSSNGTSFTRQLMPQSPQSLVSRLFGLGVIIISCFFYILLLVRRDLSLQKDVYNEELIRVILDTAADAIIIFDESGKIAGCNEAALCMLRCDRNRLLQHSIDEWIPDSLEGCGESTLSQCIIKGCYNWDAQGVELEARRLDGERFPVHIVVGHGKVNGETVYTAIIRDVSARKKAEQEYRRSHEYRRLLMEQLPAILWTTDTDLYITSVVGLESRLLDGDSLKSVMGQHVSTAFSTESDPDQAVKIEEIHRQVLSDTRQRYEAVVGSRVFSVYSEPLRDAEGSIIGTVNLSLDITSQQAMLNRLRGDEAIIDASKDAIIACDIEGRVTRWNTGAVNAFGIEVSDAVGKAIDELLPDRERVRRLLSRIGEGYSVQGKRLETDNGITLEYTAFPIRDKKGRITGVAIVGHDVTQKIRADNLETQAELTKQRILELENEVLLLDKIVNSPYSNATAKALGLGKLREVSPELFEQLTALYIEALSRNMDNLAYKQDYKSEEDLRPIAEKLGFLRAGPKDVVEMHTEALQRMTKTSSRMQADALAYESRLVVLELMGYLVSFYRNHYPGIPHTGSPQA